ncbi:MAG: T9SS type A sorting domain-containing protein [Bacteroidota bacterium]
MLRSSLLLCCLSFLCSGQSSAQGHVFPGDANADGHVNHYDLLPLTYAFGSVGPARPTGEGDVPEEILALWSDAFPDGTNYIHCDADGNGIVNLLDLTRFFSNNGIVHDPTDQALPQTFISSSQFTLLFNDGDPINPMDISGAFEVPLAVVPTGGEEEINGIAFEISWDPQFVSSVTFAYDPSWLGEDGQAISYINADENTIQIAVGRLGPNPISGGGLLGQLSIIGVEDLVGLMPTNPDTTIGFVDFNDISIVDGGFVSVQSTGQPLQFTGISAVSSTNPEVQAIEATIFPNPSRAEVNVISDQGFQRIDLIDMLGRLTNLYQGDVRKSFIYDASALPAGNYFLRLQGTDGFGTYRFIRSAE